MAFASARVLTPESDGVNGYRTVADQTGTLIAIEIEGEIIDDQIAEPWRGVMRIDGAEFAALPPSTPGIEDTPADPRYQAIMGIVLARIPAIHKQWSDAVLNTPVVTAKDAAVLATFPTITPAMLPVPTP